MPFREQRQPAQSVAQQGGAIYAVLQEQLEPQHTGRIAAIDVRSEEYEIGDTALDASRALKRRIPDAQIWLVRIGSRALRNIGRTSNSFLSDR